MEFKPRNRIPWWLAIILVVIGIGFALIGLIPVVGLLADILSWMLFWFIGKVRGVSFSKNKGILASVVISLLVGVIPEVGDFLSDIVGLIVVIYLVKREDRIYNQQMKAQLMGSQNEE